MAEPSLSGRNLPEWIKDHITVYLETDGKQGHIHNGAHALLLTTTGKKSGERFLLPLYYGLDGENPVVVASRGGAPTHPKWYTNLVAEPNVQVQVGAEKFDAIARTATAEEKPGLWKMMTKVWPPYDEYQSKTDREIPVVILERK